MNSVWGVMEPGLASTWPRWTSSPVDAAQQHPDVVAGLHLVQELPEHLQVGRGGLAGVSVTPTISTSSIFFSTPRSTAPGDHGAAAGDGEHVLDGHQEGPVGVADRLGDVGVAGVQQLDDLALGLLVALERLEGTDLDHRDLVAGELVLRQSSRTSNSTRSSSSGSSTMSALFSATTMYGTLTWTGEQDVLRGLGHRAVGGGHDQDRAVHLGGAGDHVLDVVGVARAVDVGVVAVVGLVLDVRGVDRDPALALLRGLVDLVEGREVGRPFSASTLVIAAVSVVLPWSM